MAGGKFNPFAEVHHRCPPFLFLTGADSSFEAAPLDASLPRGLVRLMMGSRFLSWKGDRIPATIPPRLFPLFSLTALLPTRTKILFYKTVKEAQLADREFVVPSGGALGGGLAINLMMHSRAQRHDWDS